MILIQCALYHEARILIEHFGLKKNMKERFFEIYEKDFIKIIISGYGKTNAAVAATYLISQVNFNANAFINIGIGGSRKRFLGEAVLINKIKDIEIGRTFYPDILLKHDFWEGTLDTYSKPVIDKDIEDVCDMEGSTFFEATSKFLPPHKIQLIKIVSDNLEGKILEHRFIYDIIKENISKIEKYIVSLERAFSEGEFFDEKDKKIIDTIAENFNLTEFQRNEFLKYFIAYKIRGENYSNISKYLNIKVKTKHEGKMFYNELIRTLSE